MPKDWIDVVPRSLVYRLNEFWLDNETMSLAFYYVVNALLGACPACEHCLKPKYVLNVHEYDQIRLCFQCGQLPEFQVINKTDSKKLYGVSPEDMKTLSFQSQNCRNSMAYRYEVHWYRLSAVKVISNYIYRAYGGYAKYQKAKELEEQRRVMFKTQQVLEEFAKCGETIVNHQIPPSIRDFIFSTSRRRLEKTSIIKAINMRRLVAALEAAQLPISNIDVDENALLTAEAITRRVEGIRETVRKAQLEREHNSRKQRILQLIRNRLHQQGQLYWYDWMMDDFDGSTDLSREQIAEYIDARLLELYDTRPPQNMAIELKKGRISKRAYKDYCAHRQIDLESKAPMILCASSKCTNAPKETCPYKRCRKCCKQYYTTNQMEVCRHIF
jgi:hypothetical protein